MIKQITERTINGNLYALLSGLCVTGYFIVNRFVYINFKPVVIDYVSTFVFLAGIIALISLLFRTKWHKNKQTVRELPKIVGLGVIATTAIATVVLGQKYTTASNAAILSTLAVAATIYFSHVLLRQTIPRDKLWWVLALFIGVYLAIIGFRAYSPRLGDILIILSAIPLGLSNTLSKPLLRNNSPATLRDYRFITGGAMATLVILLIPRVRIVTNAGFYPLLASFFFWVAIFFYYKAVETIGPAQAIVINNSHPAFTTILSVILLSESLTAPKILGVMLALIAIYKISQKR